MKKKELNYDEIKQALTEMGIPYMENSVPDHLAELIRTYRYRATSLLVDLTDVDTVDAELGVVVQNEDLTVDNGVYIFTVLHSGQAGFIVVKPGTISRAPMIRKVTGDITSAVTGLDLPPLMPFDMVEIAAHVIAGTVMKMITESCRIPKEYEPVFLKLYMPKFLANVGLYFTGATNKDGTPMVYEEIANMEPMMIWNSIVKGAAQNENSRKDGAGKAGKEKETPAP